jgi:thiamine biosynthesis lipoprotein
MGTTVEIYLYASEANRAWEVMEAAFREIERVEATLSSYRPTSEITRINAGAARGPVVTDPEVFRLLEWALDFSMWTGGGFDITVGPLVEAWGFFQGDGRLPSRSELAEARARTGWTKVVLDPTVRSVRFATPELRLDLGGVAKGWALDCAARELASLGVAVALLGAGQSSWIAMGAPPDKPGWLVEVPDPMDPGAVLATVGLRDRSLSTSGSSERHFEVGGKRYGHILDPRTGRPAEGVTQVTVMATHAYQTDALSTALFVLGPDEATELLAGRGDLSALLVESGPAAGRIVTIRWPREGSVSARWSVGGGMALADLMGVR